MQQLARLFMILPKFIFFLPGFHTISFPSHRLLSHMIMMIIGETMTSREREDWLLLERPLSILSEILAKLEVQTIILVSSPVCCRFSNQFVCLLPFINCCYWLPIWATCPPPPPRRWLVIMGDSARIHDKTTENAAWFFNSLPLIPNF